MRHLYVQSPLSFDQVASQVSSIALPGFQCELRDGQLGGGDYFLFSRNDDEIVLVANDADHAEVFVPDRVTFPYYFYVWRGSEAVLDDIRIALSKGSIVCELEDVA